MPKGYWIAMYRSVSDPDRLAEYAALAAPVIQGAGGRFVARGVPAKTFEGTENQRTVVIEFESVAKAIDAYNSPGYQAALGRLKGAAERDVRIVEGVG
jgi:uncharacterized protein (DUF1330 family)